MHVKFDSKTSKPQFQNDNIVVDYVLRYELYRHRDLSERLSTVLNIDTDPDAFNRSTWDILFFLIQSHLEGISPSVTDIYLSTGISKGTAISGLTELERRGGVVKVSDEDDKRRRMIAIANPVIEVVHEFLSECQERLSLADGSSNSPGQSPHTSIQGSGEPLIDLLHQLSHEVRTPLTAIVGFSEMIADEALGPVQPIGYAEYARDIGKAASHLLTSLNERVDTALAEHGASIPLDAVTQVDFEELVDAACRLANETSERRGVSLRRKWGAQKGKVHVDRDRMTSSVKKLIEGMASKTPRGQAIDIVTLIRKRDQSDFVCIQVTSTQLVEKPSSESQQPTLHLLNEDMLMKNLPLINAVVSAHGGFVDKASEATYAKSFELCLPRTS